MPFWVASKTAAEGMWTVVVAQLPARSCRHFRAELVAGGLHVVMPARGGGPAPAVRRMPV